MKSDFLKQAFRANLKINKYLKNIKSNDLKQLHKGFGGDKTTKADLTAERIFVKYLKNFGQIISEESGIIGSGKDKIIIDPIDGSSNLMSKFPYFGTSVALKQDGACTEAMVVNQINSDVFIYENQKAKKGKLKDKIFKKIPKNKSSKIGIFENSRKSLKLCDKLNENGFKYRSPGALALSICYANDVDFVLFCGKVREFDIAAAIKIVSNLYIFMDEKKILISKHKQIFDTISKFK